MSYMTKEAINERLQEHYDEASKRGELYGVFLQGSQNYIDDLFFINSDVDSRAVYIPSKKDIFLGRDISTSELILENSEHIDRFDVRKFVELLKKPGINNYEAIFSEYFIINEKYKEIHQKLVSMREDLARADEKKFLMATMGLSMRDSKNLQSRTGGEDEDISKYGYSRKRLSNIMRFCETAKMYAKGADFESCLKSVDQELIYAVRREELYNLEEALVIAEKCDKELYRLAHDFEGESNKEVLDELDDLLVELLELSIK